MIKSASYVLPLKLGWYKLSHVCAHCGQILAATLIGCWKNATGSDRNQRKLKVLLPRLADSSEKPSWMIFRQWREGICCLFLLFYDLVVGKYPLICAMEIQKIQIVVRIFSGFAPFTELIWVNCGVENLSRLLTAKKMLFSSLFKEFL